MRHYFQGMFHVGINSLRWKNGIGISIDSANQGVEMGTYELNVENSIPTRMVFFLMRATQMRANYNSTVAFCKFMNFFECKIQKTTNTSIIGNSIQPLSCAS